MASKPQTVLLGFADEQITVKHLQTCNYSISKIGGTPDWCVSGCEIPICKRCGRKQSLVIQIYAPLEGGLYHRTLYLFACVTQECWHRPHSWTCVRSQIIDQGATKTSSPATKSHIGETWFDDDDDWGSIDNDGNGNEDNFNMASSSQLYLDNMSKTGGARSNLNNMNSHTTSSIAEVAQNLESKLSIIEGDANANEALCGAVGMVGCAGESVEASAVIEGPEGDMIAVDTPEQPTTDIPALFQEAAQIDANADIAFLPYFVVSDVEPPEDLSFSEHERELLLRYTHTTGHDLREEESAGGGDGKGDNIYEKDIAYHGDVLLHKFKKRVSRSPRQILRYSREEGSSPLWLRPPSPSEVPSKCPHCGGSVVFEMQITPQLVSHLRVQGVQGSIIEFGSVAVYTCLASCWGEKDVQRLECVIVQGEVI